MTWLYISSTFIKIKNLLNYFWSIFVFLNTHVHYIHFHKCIPISHFIKWNGFFSNLLPRLYANIICKNILKIFQKLEVGYIQTCTSLKSNIIWQPRRGHYNVFSPINLLCLNMLGGIFCQWYCTFVIISNHHDFLLFNVP
jgi:hypothetical protein